MCTRVKRYLHLTQFLENGLKKFQKKSEFNNRCKKCLFPMLMIENEYIFTRLLTTKFYHYFVMIQIVLTACLAFMVFKQFQKAYMLEVSLTCMMAFDILIRFLGDSTSNYWRNVLNKADVIILSMLVILFGFQTVFKRITQIQEFQTAIIVIRILTQLYRMIRLIKQEKDARIVQNLQPVDLSFDHENLVDKFH